MAKPDPPSDEYDDHRTHLAGGAHDILIAWAVAGLLLLALGLALQVEPPADPEAAADAPPGEAEPARPAADSLAQQIGMTGRRTE
jgi:hypothetical protein